MLGGKTRVLTQSLRRYTRRQLWDKVDRLLSKTRDEELASVLELLGEDDQLAIFRRLPTDARKASLIVLMQPPFGQRVLEPMHPAEVAAILQNMAPDDTADILAEISPELQAAILPILKVGEQVESLMQYSTESAGGIMVPDLVAVSADDTCEEALTALRRRPEVEMAYYTYVVDDVGHLVGVLSLRRLIAAPPPTRIREVMERDVISVRTDTDQEQVAALVAKYGFLAVPVVDDTNKLVGVVTVDDVIDVLHDEATEDILKMAGAGRELAESRSLGANILIRFPWLLASCLGGLLAAWVMNRYTETLTAHHYLALFLPIVLGMSGNVGTQAATVTVRALAVGLAGSGRSAWKVIGRETVIGLSIGITYGVLVGCVGALFGDDPIYGMAIGLAMAIGMLVAAMVGASVPMLLHRLSIDPAVATGPFVTTSADILGVFTYFSIASWLAVLASE
jgi:magnesium transporter